MSDVKWIKIVTDIFDDEKILLIEALPEADSIIVIWFKLLCLAGKQNNKGVFLMSDRVAYTDEMLATIFRRPLNTIRLALATFEKYGMVEIVNNVITIPNWDKHQSLDAYERRKEQDRLRKAKKRAEQKLLSEASADCPQTVHPLEEDKKEIRKEVDKNKKKKKDIFADFAGSDTELLSALRDFEKMRASIKKPLGDKDSRARQILVNKLQSFPSSDRIAILEQSIEHCWQSVYELKTDRQGNKATSSPMSDLQALHQMFEEEEE